MRSVRLTRSGIIAVVAALAAVGLLPASAQAVPISGLFATGVDASGNALVGGNGVTDPHYTVLSSTIAGVTTGVNAVTYFNPAYAADDASSRWISHSATGSPGNGTTVFRISFDLTGFDPDTAAISGRWGTDNLGAIFLNSVDTGISQAGFTVFNLQDFTISDGFVAGINHLYFAVTDFGPPLALRVLRLSGTVDLLSSAPSVPEPATLLLFGGGLLGIGALSRRRRTTA